MSGRGVTAQYIADLVTVRFAERANEATADGALIYAAFLRKCTAWAANDRMVVASTPLTRPPWQEWASAAGAALRGVLAELPADALPGARIEPAEMPGSYRLVWADPAASRPAVIVHRAHPATSGPYCHADGNRAHASEPCTFVEADVTCPDCPPSRRPWPGPCPCECNSGGFCGGCGHGGCAGRRGPEVTS